MITQGKDSDICGPTALLNAMELLVGSSKPTLSKVIDACEESIRGTDEFSLMRGADALGFITKRVTTHHRKAALDWLLNVRAGLLCVDRWQHWVTVHGLGDKVLVIDPTTPRVEVYGQRKVIRRWALPPADQVNEKDWTYFGIELFKI